jgi:alpha-glucosidase
VFPDWLPESGAQDWWAQEVAEWYSKIKFSGIWIDMSEVSSFCDGSCGSYNVSMNPVHPSFQLPGEPGNLILTYPEGFNITNATEAASASAAAASQFSMGKPSGTATAARTVVSYLRTTPTPGVRNVNYPPCKFHTDRQLAIALTRARCYKQRQR